MSKKQKCPEFENHERWLVSYADMLTLLFAVFVVLYSLKQGGEPQVQKAAGSMQESFNKPLDDIPLDKREGPTEQGYGIFQHFQGDQIMPPVIKKFPSTREGTRIVDGEVDRIRGKLEERLYGPDKSKKKESPGQERIVSIHRTEKGFSIRLLSRYFFDSGGTSISPSSKKELDLVILQLKDLERDIVIEGHTDSMAPKGKFNNWELSALRATSVLEYMVEHHNFPKSRLSVAGYGDLKPVAHNGTEAGRQLNRRIEIQVKYNEP